ncbi:hypothetical protein BJ742DRAFT_322301 [Cladochytrium replicatum]|nr:hypothetical protein BJ742DRAFT_322301 [Cladochytrium replicatum]
MLDETGASVRDGDAVDSDDSKENEGSNDEQDVDDQNEDGEAEDENEDDEEQEEEEEDEVDEATGKLESAKLNEDGESSFEEEDESDAEEGLEKLNNRDQRPYRDAPRPSSGSSHSAKPAPVKLDAQEIKKRVSKSLHKGRSSEHTNRKRNSAKASSRRAAMENAKHSTVWG